MWILCMLQIKPARHHPILIAYTITIATFDLSICLGEPLFVPLNPYLNIRTKRILFECVFIYYIQHPPKYDKRSLKYASKYTNTAWHKK